MSVRGKAGEQLRRLTTEFEEDIAEGNRFPTHTREGGQHWSQQDRHRLYPATDYNQPPGWQTRAPSATPQSKYIRKGEVRLFRKTEHQLATEKAWKQVRRLRRKQNKQDKKVFNIKKNHRCKMSVSPGRHNNGGVSPSSSPRLPSPPPSVEVQFGPKSPSVSGAVSELSLDKVPDEGASRRIRPGTKAVDMAKGPPFLPLHRVESPFQLQEYLKSLYAKLTRDEDNKCSRAIDKDMALHLATPPIAEDTNEAVDRNLWLYELCRLLCNKTNRIIVGFFADNPPCSSQTCPEMRASEWQYLCAVHEPPKSCCAIDYCNHTLDWASNVLTSNKHFPSRLALGGETGNTYQSMRQLINVFRRVYRIYAHAWFQHREVFWAIETELGLYMLFKTVCDQYNLIPEDNYTIPPEAEGDRDARDDDPPAYSDAEKTDMPPTYGHHENTSSMSILRKEPEQSDQVEEDHTNSATSTGATTRRHKHTPSTGVPIDVIAEGQEDDEGEETTIIDIGGPGPAEETTQALLSPSVRNDRAKSPGLIIMPPKVDLERAPEDPTPLASYENSPFGGPGPSEVTVTVSDDETHEEGTKEISPITHKTDEIYPTLEEKQESAASTESEAPSTGDKDGADEATEDVKGEDVVVTANSDAKDSESTK